jgi:hypothetical protein
LENTFYSNAEIKRSYGDTYQDRKLTNVVVFDAQSHPLEPERDHKESGSLQSSINTVILRRWLAICVGGNNMLPVEHQEARDCSNTSSNDFEQDELLSKDAAKDCKLNNLADMAVLLICLLGTRFGGCQSEQKHPADVGKMLSSFIGWHGMACFPHTMWELSTRKKKNE